MANTKKYVSLDKLGLYDEKIKKVITDGDAAALDAAKKYADGLAVNYDAAGSAATAEANAKAYADGKDAAIAAAKKAGDDAAAAAAVADGKAVAAQGEIDALELYVGTIPAGATATDVIGYVQEKTSGIASEGAMNELGNRVTAVEGDVATIKGDYLKGADKTELEGKITAVQTAVDTEKSRAEGIEAGLASRIKAVEDDYLKAADKTELQGNIDTVAGALERLTNGVSADEIDGVNDLINYVKEHGPEVTGMQEDIAENAEAIAGVKGRMDTAEGKITAVEGAVATKAEKTYVDEQVQALQGVDSGLDTRLKAVEAKFGEGEGNVESQISTAKQEAIDAAAADATSKANAAEAAAKGHADSLNTAMNTRVEALEAIDHDHANKAELDLIASGDKAKWDTAAGKAHEHSNLSVLEGITSAKVTAWDAAEGNAKGYADGLNTAMDTRVVALETWHNNFTEVSEDEINALFA
jgi:uncharacterized protein YqgV (UPF0045/DUF77 family)